MTLREAWNLGKKRLTAAEVPDADLDAWYLLEWCTGVSRSHYLAYPDEIISHDQEEQYRASLCKAGTADSPAADYRRAGIYGALLLCK